jgi:hypothetical protein
MVLPIPEFLIFSSKSILRLRNKNIFHKKLIAVEKHKKLFENHEVIKS